MSLGCPVTPRHLPPPAPGRADDWHSPARQAARDARRVGWARGVLDDPAAHSPARIRRATRILTQIEAPR